MSNQENQAVVKHKGKALQQKLFSVFLFSLLLLLLALFVLPPTAAARTARKDAVLSIGTMRRMGAEATVPIIIKDISDLASGSFAVKAPTNGSPISYHSIRFSSEFDGGTNSLFNSFSRRSGDSLLINFISIDGAGVDIDTKTIGYITYNISPNLSRGDFMTIDISEVNFRDSQGAEITIKQIAGRIEKNRRLGDTEGKDSVNPLSAIRILQHLSGRRALTNSDALAAVDLNANDIIDINDAKMLLQYIVGTRDNFFTIKTATLPPALLESDYFYTLQAVHGNEPYTWVRASGRLPSGLNLDPDTGKISGIPTRRGEFTFTVRATDRDNNQVERKFNITVTESEVAEIDPIPPVKVKKGEIPVLPSQVKVTYRDGTTSMENITWDSIDTNSIGTKTIIGSVGATGLKVKVEVTITAEDPEKPVEYIQQITILPGFLFPNLRTIWVEAAPEVSFVEISFTDTTGRRPQKAVLSMHYEGENRFSLATTRLQQGMPITITAYDRFSRELKKIEQIVP